MFLVLVEHHLFDCGSGIAVEVGQLRILRLYLLSVDLNISLNQAVPPVAAFVFLNGDIQGALVSISLEIPKALSSIDLLVPFSPDFVWCKHTTSSAHVTEGTLSRS